ncbi:MAG: glycosyltransferase family 39 protein [Anaerolineae bacterium]|nr:glycosyltransferase family 39 protein [Anaerolineae bacterium]
MRLQKETFWIVVVALVLRLGVVCVTVDLPIGLDDMFQYDMLARSIVAGNGYRWYAEDDLELITPYVDMEVPPEYDPLGIRTSFRPPLYPAFLAIIYFVVGVGPHRFFAARVAQAVLGAGLVALTAALGRRLGLTGRAARLGALFVALYPLLIVYPLALATENLFLPLLALSLWAVLRAQERGQARDVALAGLLFGLTALTRSVVTFFVPLAALWMWRTALSRREGFKRAVVLVLCFLALTLPWSARNTLLHGEFHFIESALGYDLFMGYHPQSSGTFDWRIDDLLYMLDDGARHAQGMAGFWSFVRADPGRIPTLMLNKFSYFWGLDKRAFVYFYGNDFFGHWPAGQLAAVLSILCGPFVLVAPLGLAGLALMPERKEKGLAALLLAYYVGIHMLILAEPRFHEPLVPILSLLAAYTLAERPWKTASPRQKGLALLLVLVLLLNWGWEIARDWELLMALFGPEGHVLHRGY